MGSKIFNYVSEFVDRFLLYRWDWIAILLSICALFVAYKTLRSQLKTQANTSPIMTREVQYSLLTVIGEQIVKIWAMTNALLTIHKNYKQDIRPEDYVLHWLNLDNSLIHEELFYSTNVVFESIHVLKQQVDDYNYYVASVVSHINEKGINEDSCNKIDALLKEVANKLFDAIDILSQYEKTTIRDDVMKLMKERVKNRFAEWAEFYNLFGNASKIEKYEHSPMPVLLKKLFEEDNLDTLQEKMDKGTLFFLIKLGQ